MRPELRSISILVVITLAIGTLSAEETGKPTDSPSGETTKSQNRLTNEPPADVDDISHNDDENDDLVR